MRKTLLLVLAILSATLLTSCGSRFSGPVPVCHLLVCCRGYNSGSTFLVQDNWNPAHDYRDIAQVRDILQKIKEAGINVVSIDFTNPSQWEAWDEYGKMLDNIVTVCHEKEMEFLIFIGNPAAWTMKYWNGIAGKIWDKYAQDPSYRRYGFGDDRPLMVVFLPGESFWPLWENTPDEEKDNLKKFRLGTCQVNDPIDPCPSDGWGYRNISESSDGAVRFCSPNSGVPPEDWARVDAAEWERRVEWALGAKEYAVVGSYDDTCDAIHWGISDASASERPVHINPSTVNDPFIYYNIVKKALK